MNLIEALTEIKDPRRKEGMRYPLTPVLLVIIMSIMSGRNGFREIDKYAKANKDFFLEIFPKKRTQLPSHVTYRKIIKNINFNEVLVIFEAWALSYITIEKNEWLAIDGKALGSTVTNYSNNYQNFVSLVSVFSQKRGQIIATSKLENNKSSEIPTVKELIERLDLKNVVFTLDALHCQKKH